MQLPDHGVAGGAAYDALVAATAVANAAELVTCDRRGLPVYESYGVQIHLRKSARKRRRPCVAPGLDHPGQPRTASRQPLDSSAAGATEAMVRGVGVLTRRTATLECGTAAAAETVVGGVLVSAGRAAHASIELA